CGTGCRQQRWFRGVDSDGWMGGHRHVWWGRATGGTKQTLPGPRHKRRAHPVTRNNLGQVVCASALVTPSFAFARHAFVWTSSGGMVDLGTLGGPSSAAAAVNQSGHVVGWAQTAGTPLDKNWRAFLWTAASGMVNLGTLGGPYSVARDVNE